MAVMRNDPGWVKELVSRLGYERTYPAAALLPWLEPHALWAEVEAFARDPRPSNGHREKAWRSLVRDLDATLGRLGPALTNAAGVGLSTSAVQLRKGATHVRSKKGRLALRRASSKLQRSLFSAAAIAGAWEDVREAYSDPGSSPDVCSWRVAVVLALVKGHGLDPVQTAWRISRVLAGGTFDVEIERANFAGQELEELPPLHGKSRMNFEERWRLCGQLLERTPDREKHIVWLAFEDARAVNMVVRVGDVTFYDGHWWQSATQGHAGEHGTLPDEIDSPHLDSWFGGMPKNGEFVLARVEVTDSSPAEAIELARERVAALVALASFAEGRTTWVLRSDYLLYAANGRIAASYGSMDPAKLAKLLRGRPADDRTADRLVQLSPHLPERLLSERSGVADALAAIQWFQHAKEMPAASRLAISLRVTDQIAAVLSMKWFTFLRAEMLRTWMKHWMFAEIDDLAYSTAVTFRQSTERKAPDKELEPTMRKIASNDLANVNRVEFIRALDILASRNEFRRFKRRLNWLAAQLRNGKSAAAWMDELAVEFDLLVHRVQRVRNAIIHGGPIVPSVVTSVTNFLVANTLESMRVWTEADLRNEGMPQAFRRNRRRHDRCFNELRRGVRPERALIWEGLTALTE